MLTNERKGNFIKKCVCGVKLSFVVMDKLCPET